MSKRIRIHPDNPQARLLMQVCEALNRGEVIAYPTDSTYALGCLLGEKQAMKRIRRMRELDESHDFSLLCHDLSTLSQVAQVDNTAFRYLKQHTPGPYTFILKAAKSIMRQLDGNVKTTVGLRIPDHTLLQDLLAMLGKPLVSVSLIAPGDSEALTDPEDIEAQYGHDVDVLIDAGYCHNNPTSVIDLTQNPPEVIRRGIGGTSAFET